jgi:CHAD domain-containing protein
MAATFIDPPAVPLKPGEDAFGGFRRVLDNLASAIDANLDGAIHDTDPELLHELRVAIRRTRTVLVQGLGILPSDVRDRYRESFGWLGQVTGPARDLDVFILGWNDLVAPVADRDSSALDRVRSELVLRRQAAHVELAEALCSTAAREVLDSWRSWLADRDVAPINPRALGGFVAHRIAKAQKRVLADGRSITAATPPERLHDLRKDTKKLRYLLECFGGLFDAKPRKAFVRQLKALQENLGQHQDAEVHVARLRQLAHDLHAHAIADTDDLLAMGRLIERLDHRRLRERDDFGERFAAYDRRTNHKLLEAMLRRPALDQ